MVDLFNSFTERARSAPLFAQEEAQRFDHNCIGTAHLLLGVVRAHDGIAGTILDGLGVTLPLVRQQITTILVRGSAHAEDDVSPAMTSSVWRPGPARAADEPPPLGLSVSTEIRRLLERSQAEVTQRNAPRIMPRHLLLALIHDGSGSAALLSRAGVDLDQLRAAIDSPSGSEDPPAP